MIAEHLRVERLRAPKGIAVSHPEFTWILQDSLYSEGQIFCEVEVDNLAPDNSTKRVWQSGILSQRIGDEVRYSGEALQSRSVYQWRVRVADDSKTMDDWSDWAEFETGIIAPDKFSARWISGGKALRSSIFVAAGLVRARAYVSGLGCYEFFCNGIKVSAATLAPSMTEFEKRIEYEIIDLLPHLTTGANQLGFLLGDGWWRHGAEAQSLPLQAIGEIVLDYADGHRESFCTDETWQAAPGPLLGDASPYQIFDGVYLDLGWLQSAWSDSQKTKADWRPAQVIQSNIAELVPTLLPPVRETEILQPREIRQLSDSLLSVDFGQNFTGWVRLRARGVNGSAIVVRHAELLEEDGRLNPATLWGARQTDTFQLSGASEGELVEPRLLYHGFRYAEIETEAKVAPDSIEGVVIHTDLEEVGHVTTSDARLNWLFDALRWTVRSNAFGLMTDCSQRDERRGWLMDGLSGLKTGLLHYDLSSLGRKWLEDMLDSQQADGSLGGDAAPAWGAWRSVGWQRAVVLLPITLYETYGDVAALRRALPAMKRYADFLLSNLQDDLLPDDFSHHPAEWLCIGRSVKGLSDNALAIDVLRQFARAGRLVNQVENVDYDAAADQIAAAAHRRWYDLASACYAGGEGFAQSSQVYALRFGITPPQERVRVFERLVDDLMNARGEGPFVTTGVGSTEHLPIVLSEFGRDDLVWRWLQRNAYPGYGWMQQCGATAIWERWEHMTYRQMNAHNHTGLTGIGVWLRESLIGIRTEPASEPIFHLRPAVQLPIAFLEARWKSRWGEILVAWQRDENRSELSITIPPGCSGRLTLPGKADVQQFASGTHQIPLSKMSF